MATLIDTSTLLNQDISSALLVHTYTPISADPVYVRLFADQVVGGGDYVAYITIQRGGAGSFYRVIPISTAEAAAGVTSVMFISAPPIMVSIGDILRVYLTGLAGDAIAAADIITEIWQNEFAAPGDAMTLANDSVTAAAIAADAITEIQAGLATSANQTTLIARIGAFTGTGVNTILGFLKAIMSKAATLPSDVGGTFSPVTDSLEALQEELAASIAVNSSTDEQSDVADITRRRGDTWVIDIVTGDNTGYSQIDWAIKDNPEIDDDNEAIIWVRLNSPSANDGLMRVKGNTIATYGLAASDASIAVISSTLIRVTVKPAATSLLLPKDQYYTDTQVKVGAVVSTTGYGFFEITKDVVRAI